LNTILGPTSQFIICINLLIDEFPEIRIKTKSCTTNVQQPSQASTAPQLASMHMIGQHRIESYTTPVPYRKQSDIKSFSRQHYISQLYYRFTI